MMLVQTSSVIQILTGRDSGWNPQARDSDRVPWPLLWRFHSRHVLAGVVLAVAAGAISWRLLAWMSPALLGLVLAVPLSAFMGSAAAGRGARPLGPAHDPGGATAAGARRRRRRRGRGRCSAAGRAPGGLPALLADPAALARHLAWLDPATARRPGEPDAAARERAPQARRRPRPGVARRPRDLRRARLAEDARGPDPAARRPPSREVNDL